jgi:hypothetical protein
MTGTSLKAQLTPPSVAVKPAAATPAPSARCRHVSDQEALMKKVVLWAVAVFAAVLVSAPTASAGGGSITANLISPGGVYFTVAGKATGGRDYFAIAVNCLNGYATRIFVTAPGDSQTIYPGSGKCTADLQTAQSINKFRTLETIEFTVP